MPKNLLCLLSQVLLLSALSTTALASETDNITHRNLKTDAREWLNQRMNDAIEEAAMKANPKNSYSVHKKLFKSLGGLFWAKIEKWADEPGSPAEHVKFEDSIFRDVGNVRGDSSFLRKLIKFKSYYSPGIYKMDNVVFGADKLGHFLQLGYSMYLANEVQDNPKFKDVRPFHIRMADRLTGDKKFRDRAQSTGLQLAIEYSDFEENGSWGMTGPLAKSWADMAANVEGFKFWSELTDGPNPYVKRDTNGRWYQARKFDWATYVNPAWDEAINRSDYDPRIQGEIDKRFEEAFKNSRAELPSVKEVIEVYGEDTPKIFNTRYGNVFAW
ncbi:hypothetical protein EZJ49_08075 [Bdellovibrio bacteriovorus]|uniref:hypothetical protein n=1 Tax=Bdellovibrio bacteriovorus TaxID=959 RepID=UPI0021CF0E1C|nr:hypothetical protein [Bdellovibrio bacteriovorus]UXR66205.1 hypothetical protein EZJ49_08075 [Bdellovibrio bacteriovorus]